MSQTSTVNSEWLNTLIRSQNEQQFSPFGEILPAFPPEELQTNTTGKSGYAALFEASAFYEDVLSSIESLNVKLSPEWKVLDFGSAWGRIARVLMRDFKTTNIIGLEVDPNLVKLANKLFAKDMFLTCNAMPPSSLEEGSLDLVVAYSVFSHLSEQAASAWIKEFAKLLRKGGFLAFTTRNESYLDAIEQLANKRAMLEKEGRDASKEEGHSEYLTMLAKLFPQEEMAETRYQYRQGKFIWRPMDGGSVRADSFYGEAMIPITYVTQMHGEQFELVSTKFDPKRYDQCCFVLRRK
jgi:2-polyprenyl-3-methyl-5-hydroxy-6-metoxy-1,4-benzoquinol methylase